MTQLIGKPDVPANTPLRATVTYTGAYQRGDALGIGTVTYTWDWTDSRWERTDGTLANIIAARFNQNDPAPPALRILFRIGTGDGTLGRPVEVLAAETAAGVLDVTKPLISAPYIRGEELTALIEQVEESLLDAQNAAAFRPDAEAAAAAKPDALAAAAAKPAAQQAAAYLPTLQAAKNQADQDHTRANADHQQVTEHLVTVEQSITNANAAAARVEADVDRTFAQVAWGVMDETGRAALSIDLNGHATVHGALTAAGAVHESTDGAAWAITDETGRAALWVDGMGITHGTFQDMSAATLPLPARDITAFGDSMTEGAGTDNFEGAWLTQLATRHPDLMAGRTLTKRGIVGQTSDQIAGRAGGRVTLLTGFRTLPASGGVTVTPSINLLDPNRVNTNPQPYATSIRGRVKGVPGTLSVNASGVYTFSRDTPGTALPIAAEGTVFTPDVDRRAVTVVWAGRNNLLYPDQIVADVQSVTDRLYEEVAAPRYLVISVVNMQDEEPAGHLYNDKAREVNSKLMRLYGDRFIDVRGAVTAGRADDTPDPQYMSPDKLHFNATGYALVADLVAAKLTEKGW